MTTASGIEKKVILASQVGGQGVVAAAGAASAVYLRRVTSGLNMTKETYQSNELNVSRQVSDFRHGVQSIEGSIAGELSPGAYHLFQAAILRKAWTTGETAGAHTDCTAAATSGAAGTFTSVAHDYLADGFKVGDVVRWAGFVGGAVPTGAVNNNAHNFLITALTQYVMTVVGLDGVAPVADSSGDSVTCGVVGKKVWIPSTAHTEDWFTIEHNYSDIDLSELYWDLKVNTMSVKLPATGIATTDFGLMGLNHTNLLAGASPYFSSPAAQATGGVLAAVNGAIYVAGTKIALLTGLDFDIAGNLSAEGVVGSNVKPDIFDGRIIVKGNMSLFFENATFRNYFENETEVAINCVFTDSNDANADFIAFTLPRVKVGGASKDDGEKGIIQTMPFTALLNTAGDDGVTTTLATLNTTLSMQDSTL